MADPVPKSTRPEPDLQRSAEEDRTLTDSAFAQLPRAARSGGSHPSFLPDTVLANRFKVVRFIARGGMGEVYEADDLELSERVAVKCIRFEYSLHENATERFKREIQVARKVTHQNVCRTYDVFRHVEENAEDGPTEILIVSMELLAGKTLSDWIFEKRKLTSEEALPIVVQMAAGLGAAHDAGIIHRDFKSSNVLLVPAERSPNGMRAVITDFGLARGAADLGAKITGTLDVVGTPAYMAPEQLRSWPITPATDIYALGIVMFEMLTGRLPFAGDSTIAMALRRLSEPAPSPSAFEPGLDEKWERTILHCLERESAHRFQTTEEVVKTLTGETAAPPRRQEKTTKVLWQRWLAAVGLLVVVIAAVWAFYKRGNSASVKPDAKQQQAATTAKTRPSIAILGFQNLSESKNMNLVGGMLADGLWSQLDTEEIRFIAPSRVDEMNHNLGLTGVSSSPDEQQLAKIRDYLGSDILVTGTYRGRSEAKSNQIDWNIHLLNARDGNSLASFNISGTEAELNGMVARAGKQIRDKLNVQLSLTEQARLDSSLSSNTEALKAFADAREKRQGFDLQGAIRSLQNAVNADPNFAQAHSALAEAWAELGYDGKAEAEAKKALDAKGKLSAEAQGLVTGRYYEMTHDWPKAVENYASLRMLYGDDPEYALLLAKSQTNASNGQAALTTLEQAGKLNLTKGIAAQIDLAKSKAQESVGDYHEQLASASAATGVAQSMGSNLLAARGLIEQCAALLNLGEPDKARPLCEEAKRLNLQAGDHLGAAKATNVVANVAYQQGDFDAAKQMYTQALGIAETIGDRLDQAGALNNIANILRTQGNLAESEKTYRKSIAVAQERGDKPDVALAMQNLAIVLYQAGDSRAGRKMFLDSAEISRDIGDKSTEAMALDNLCIISLEAGEPKEARQHCANALKLRREIDSKPDIARSLVSRGHIEMVEGNMKDAKRDYEDSLQIQDSGGLKGDAAYTRIALSRLAFREKRFEDSRKYAEDAASELASEKDGDGEAEARSAAALAKLALKDNDGAAKHIEAALKLTQKSGDRQVKLEVEMASAKLDLAEGRTEEAIRSLEKIGKEGRASGLVALGMESALTLGAAQMQAGNRMGGKAILSRLSKEAKSKGFVVVAERAQMEEQNAHRE